MRIAARTLVTRTPDGSIPTHLRVVSATHGSNGGNRSEKRSDNAPHFMAAIDQYDTTMQQLPAASYDTVSREQNGHQYGPRFGRLSGLKILTIEGSNAQTIRFTHNIGTWRKRLTLNSMMLIRFTVLSASQSLWPPRSVPTAPSADYRESGLR